MTTIQSIASSTGNGCTAGKNSTQRLFIASTTVANVLAEVKPLPHRQLVDLPSTATMEEALDIFLAEDILSAPVYRLTDGRKEYITIVSVLDLLKLLSSHVSHVSVVRYGKERGWEIWSRGRVTDSRRDNNRQGNNYSVVMQEVGFSLADAWETSKGFSNPASLIPEAFSFRRMNIAKLFWSLWMKLSVWLKKAHTWWLSNRATHLSMWWIYSAVSEHTAFWFSSRTSNPFCCLKWTLHGISRRKTIVSAISLISRLQPLSNVPALVKEFRWMLPSAQSRSNRLRWKLFSRLLTTNSTSAHSASWMTITPWWVIWVPRTCAVWTAIDSIACKNLSSCISKSPTENSTHRSPVTTDSHSPR